MAILGTLGDAEFIDRHWQRKPLLVRGALADTAALVDGDDLAGLACEEAVDARLVIHDAARDAWQCEDGPFDADRFAMLPRRGWTLLVQAVDQHLPDVAALREQIDAALAHAFGCQLTEVRHPERIGDASTRDRRALARRLAGNDSLQLAHDPASRFAYTLAGEHALLFVDGEAWRTSAALARGVCHARLALHELRGERDRAVLLELLAQGSLSVRGRR